MEERRNLSTLLNAFNMTTLQETFPYIDWHEFINWNLNNAIPIYDNETIYVSDVDYVRQLEKILKSTSKRTIANYFGMRLTLYSSTYLNDVLHQREQQYENEVAGVQKPDPRITECMQITMALYIITFQKLFNKPKY